MDATRTQTPASPLTTRPDGSALSAPLRRLPTGAGLVALTFDDGPDPRFTPPLLDLLDAAGVMATFFVIASQAVRYPAIIQRMRAGGHTVASHGWTHRHPWLQSASAARRQVQTAGHALATLTGQPPRWFRPPHGRMRACMHAAADQMQQQVVLWSLSAVDWGPWANPSRVSRRLHTVSDGDIVLMHDGRNRHNRPGVTLVVLPALLSTLAARGLRPVALR